MDKTPFHFAAIDPKQYEHKWIIFCPRLNKSFSLCFEQGGQIFAYMNEEWRPVTPQNYSFKTTKVAGPCKLKLCTLSTYEVI